MKITHPHKGFTLLEVMVVVIIIATISGLSMLGLKQASDRRYISQADNLFAWLQQISELAMIEGTAYGLTRNEQTIYGMVFYRQRWHLTANPEPFQLFDEAEINLPDNKNFKLSDDKKNQQQALLPDLVFLPTGYFEPNEAINLYYRNQVATFSFQWDPVAFNLIMASSNSDLARQSGAL